MDYRGPRVGSVAGCAYIVSYFRLAWTRRLCTKLGWRKFPSVSGDPVAPRMTLLFGDAWYSNDSSAVSESHPRGGQMLRCHLDGITVVVKRETARSRRWHTLFTSDGILTEAAKG